MSAQQGATGLGDGCKGHPAQREDILAGKATIIKYVKLGRMRWMTADRLPLSRDSIQPLVHSKWGVVAQGHNTVLLVQLDIYFILQSNLYTILVYKVVPYVTER